MKAQYTTQGGGICELVGNKMVWVEVPENFPRFIVGQPIPNNWGTIAINSRAIDEMEFED